MRVDKDSGMVRVGKDSGRIHEWVSSHFMAWHVEFQPRIAFPFWNCDMNVVVKVGQGGKIEVGQE